MLPKVTKCRDFSYIYLPAGWPVWRTSEFIDLRAGQFWIWNQMRKGCCGFETPLNFSPPTPVNEISGFNGQVRYLIFSDQSLLMLTNGMDEVWTSITAFVEEYGDDLEKSEFQHDKELLNLYKE